MSWRITGVIEHISDIVELESGAKRLSYRIKTNDEYNNIYQFEIYKKSEYAEHVDNFVKYNNIGDCVNVEFNISCREWNDKYYTNLQHWKCEKSELSESPQAIAQPDRVDVSSEESDEPLPF